MSAAPPWASWREQPNPEIPYPATQLEKDPKPSKSLVRETRLAGDPCCSWGAGLVVVMGDDFASPALLIAGAVLPLRFHVASIAVPFDLLTSRIELPCWRAIIQEVRRERALDAHVPGMCAANAAAARGPVFRRAGAMEAAMFH